MKPLTLKEFVWEFLGSLAVAVVALAIAVPDARAQVPIYTRQASSTDLASPGPIGGTTPSTITGTTITGTIGFLMPDGTVTAPGWCWTSDNDGTCTGMYRRVANGITVSINGVSLFEMKAGSFNLASTQILGWTAGAASTATADTGVARNAQAMVEINTGTAGTLADLKLRRLTSSQTTAPTCSNNCGTSPSVVGGDTAGIITMGASGVPASPFTLTFNGTWASAPSCSVTMALATMVVGKMGIAAPTTTTTMIVTTNGTAPATSDKYQYICVGVS